MKLAILALAAAFSLGGCAQYDQFARNYDRSYSLSYADAEGSTLGTGVTLHPVNRSGLAK